MNKCYLSLGSNRKMPERQIRRAIKALRALPCSVVVRISKLHRTKAWGSVKQPDFLNAAIELHTSLSPIQLLRACQAIEKAQKRVRKTSWGPRTLDIDLLTYTQRTIQTKYLKLPHPQMHLREFVLIPLKEIKDNLH